MHLTRSPQNTLNKTDILRGETAKSTKIVECITIALLIVVEKLGRRSDSN